MRANLLWLLFVLLTFIVTLPISWVGLAKVNFFYPAIYESIGIDKHIQRYAPRNNFNKLGFEKTTKDERIALFHGVVTAIHNNGDGLDSLAYTRVDQALGNQQVTLFTDAEVTHLKDVAHLLNKIKPLLLVVIAVWILSIAWMLWQRIKLPSLWHLTKLALIWLVIIVLVLLLGPEKIFNQLHIWAFPENNQWFFYYEDSLMSTMMKAPLLFAVISAIWFVFSVLLTIVLFRLMHPILLLKRNRNNE